MIIIDTPMLWRQFGAAIDMAGDVLHTKAYARRLIVQRITSTRADVEAKQDVTAAALLGSLDRRVAGSMDWDALDPFTRLGINAIALGCGRRAAVDVAKQPR